MKLLVSIFIFSIVVVKANGQQAQPDLSRPDTTKKIIIAEVSCGECKFNLKGEGCDLAVRIKRKAYFVDGADIDSFGDAHADDGFCKAIRKAEIQGKVVNHRFKVTYLKMLP
jgi:hypothetical protein